MRIIEPESPAAAAPAMEWRPHLLKAAPPAQRRGDDPAAPLPTLQASQPGCCAPWSVLSSQEYAEPMQRPPATPGLDGSLEPTRDEHVPWDSASRLRPLVEAIQLARWESEGGALRESERRTS
jgi:hypothetical protein